MSLAQERTLSSARALFQQPCRTIIVRYRLTKQTGTHATREIAQLEVVEPSGKCFDVSHLKSGHLES